jgi:hypothetical protein
MCFCGYFALSNGPNCEVIWIIQICCIIFGQNLGTWPNGVTIYRVNPYCLAINFEEMPSCFVLNVFLWLLCIIKWSKLGSYLRNTNIWRHLWSEFGYLTTRGDHIYGYPLLFSHSFWRNPIMLCPKCMFVVTLHYQMVKIRKLFE